MCKKNIYIFTAFLLIQVCANQAWAQYAVADIPDSLVKSAIVVKRQDETVVQIRSISKAIIYHKYAYTIMNEAGQDFAAFIDGYDKFRRINSINGTLYDKNGNKVKQVKHRDIYDGAYNDQMSLARDIRFKHYDFAYRNYPYTVEYEEEIEMNGIFYLPDWDALSQSKVSVQNSSFTVQVPADYVLRYKQYNYPGEPFIEQPGKEKKYRWELKNRCAVEPEPYAPAWEERAPVVLIAPADFEIEGYKGNMNDWLHFGQFINQLYSNRDVLPQFIKDKVHQLTDGVSDPKEKIRQLYEFMQENTHYISIQLGIGGWQPFDATYVATKKYGDCKALSNYMCALLKEAGINANTVLIRAGKGADKMVADFPSNQFNHAIACVPMGKDTVWLECTSQTVSAGYMGTFTGGRKALLLAADGGYVVTTPSYTAADNLQERKVTAEVDENGNLVAEVNTRTKGEQQELAHHLIHDVSKEERDKKLNTMLNLPTYSVAKNDYKEIKGALPEVHEYMKIESPNYAAITSKRLFIQPNLLNSSHTRLTPDTLRKTDVVIKNSFRNIDTILIHVPAGYKVESMPANTMVNNRFGAYSISYHFADDKITLVRMHEMHAARFPPKSYADLVKLYDAMYKGDVGRVVLVKNQL